MVLGPMRYQVQSSVTHVAVDMHSSVKKQDSVHRDGTVCPLSLDLSHPKGTMPSRIASCKNAEGQQSVHAKVTSCTPSSDKALYQRHIAPFKGEDVLLDLGTKEAECISTANQNNVHARDDGSHE